LGWAFPVCRGGPVGQIQQIGLARFTEDCRTLAAAHGARFAPPALLEKMAATGGAFYDV
jgi:3-hydroxyacyl-CoA dehydrogenase/enoyl-CoA hydratase/3-hydroxybutyryl-CoA epimerase